jgi:type IV secretory pathway TrbL component
MNGLNSAFFNVLEKLIDLQPHFIAWAWNIARVVMLIALGFICVKHAISGQGLKEGLIKLGMAFTLFTIVINCYPRIIQKGGELMYNMAFTSTYEGGLASFFTVQKEKVVSRMEQTGVNERHGYATYITKSEKVPDGEPRNYFTELFVTRSYESASGNKFAYTTLAPKAALEIVLLVAGEALRFSDENPLSFGKVIKGLLVFMAVIITGVFGICEYLICMLEFMLVTSVGVVLLPFMLWESSKFLTEKLIGAIVGFFVKLLFCNICIYLMLYGFMALAANYTETEFTGTADEMVSTLFTCVLFFFICKSGPNLAQSLLTGSPSLNSGAAFAAVGGAVAGAAGAAGIAGKAGAAAAGAGALGAFNAAGALTKAGAAAGAAGALGGGKKDMAGAFLSSMGGSAKETARSAGSGIARSLLGGKADGYNRHSQLDRFLHEKQGGGGTGGGAGGTGGRDGPRRSFGEHFAGRAKQGENAGLDYMAKKEARQAAKGSAS